MEKIVDLVTILGTAASLYIAARSLRASNRTFELVNTPILLPRIRKTGENYSVGLDTDNIVGILKNIKLTIEKGQLRNPIIVCSDEFLGPKMFITPIVTSEDLNGSTFVLTYKNLTNREVKITGRVHFGSDNKTDYRELDYCIK